MGAWGAGPFDNDDAADLIMELESTPSWDVVRQVFHDVMAHNDFVELSEGARAYAAAALLTVAHGKSDVSAQDYHMILDAMGPAPRDLTLLAKMALRRVSTGDSEIRELYLDSGSYKTWLDLIHATDEALT
jgi:hypothetical protein